MTRRMLPSVKSAAMKSHTCSRSGFAISRSILMKIIATPGASTAKIRLQRTLPDQLPKKLSILLLIWFYLLKHAGSSDKLPAFNDRVLDDAVARITVDPGNDKELLEAQVACAIHYFVILIILHATSVEPMSRTAHL